MPTIVGGRPTQHPVVSSLPTCMQTHGHIQPQILVVAFSSTHPNGLNSTHVEPLPGWYINRSNCASVKYMHTS